MEHMRLFRRRFLPDEITELKDDVILSHTENLIITKWNVIKPRKDISHGISAYFVQEGVKVSKVFTRDNQLVYWYCDIVEPEITPGTETYIFNDLLIDVLVYPDGHVEVVDMDEFADIMEKNILSPATIVKALRCTDALLKKIYSGKFHDLTKYIDEAEKAIKG